MHQQEEQTNANKVHQETHWNMYAVVQQQQAAQQEQAMAQQQGTMNSAANIGQAQLGNQAATLNQKEAPQVLNN